MKTIIIFVSLSVCFVFSNKLINATGFEDFLRLRSKSATLNEGGIFFKKMKPNTSEYISLHMWLKYHYGKASKCENPNCKCKNIKRYEYALIKGKEYERKRENFMMLCKSCHAKYDGVQAYLYWKKDSLYKINEAKYIKINQLNLNGIFIKTWKGAKEVFESLLISRSAINNCLKGLSKKAGGYKWEYAINK